MKKIVLAFAIAPLLAQGQAYVPIDCWGVNQVQVNTAPLVWEFTNANCIESEGNVSITGSKIMSFKADNVVHLAPGFNASGFTGGGSFHAYIQKGDFEPVVYHPIDSPGEVGKWEKLEIGVPLPGDLMDEVNEFIATETGGLNPFDPDQLRIEADFDFMAFPHVVDAAFSQTVDGFYYRDFYRQIDTDPEHWWMEQPTDHHFRVRFAPSHLGTYRCKISIYVNGVLTYTANEFQFKCVPSDNKGPLVYGNTFTSDKRHRYLKYYETDEMFFANGTNIYWYGLERLDVKDYLRYEEWLTKIRNNGGNYAAISSIAWTHGVEWEKLNNYYDRMANAWELDHIIEVAEQNDIYLNLLTLIHDEMQVSPHYNVPNNGWDDNCYNRANNGFKTNCINPNDFLTDEDAKRFFKFRLRYLMARYGYSVNLPIIELASEIDNAWTDEDASSGLRDDIKDWFIEMRGFIRTDRAYKYKMVSGSYTHGPHQSKKVNQRIFSESDVVLLHLYDNDKSANFEERYTMAKDLVNTGPAKNKPIIFDEGGEFWVTADYATDLPLHTNQWATSFMGCFGGAQNWNWQICTFPQGYESNFKGLEVFLQGENFANDEYKQERWTNNTGAYDAENTKFEAFYLRDDDGGLGGTLNGSEEAIGWLHNTSYWWGNLENHNTIIANCIDLNLGYNVPGAPLNTVDEFHYEDKKNDDPENDGDNDLTPYTGYTFKIQGLRKFKKYEISWYYTDTGLPTFISDEDVTDAIGTAKFDIPSVLTPDYGDLAFKVKLVENKSLIITDSVESDNIEISDSLEDFAVKIYPNPARDMISIETTAELDRAEIYAIDGSLVQVVPIQSTVKQFPVSLQAGYYTVVIYSRTNGIVSKKLCILR